MYNTTMRKMYTILIPKGIEIKRFNNGSIMKFAIDITVDAYRTGILNMKKSKGIIPDFIFVYQETKFSVPYDKVTILK